MATTKKAMFPTVVYGIIVNNVSEGREACMRHFKEVEAARAAETSHQTEAEIARLMMEGNYSHSEARFLAQGGYPCNSVSAFV
ncbi:MAG: hypothetical protein IJ218_01060 [Alphaproteobacteria bacterium]|nr:hypothetical protein [Alphaproteobacteria bacterium]